MGNFSKVCSKGGSKKKVIEYIKSDLYRYEGKTTWKSFVKYYRKNAGFRFLVAYRLVNAKCLLKIIGRNPLDIPRQADNSNSERNKNWIWVIYKPWWSGCC